MGKHVHCSCTWSGPCVQTRAHKGESTQSIRARSSTAVGRSPAVCVGTATITVYLVVVQVVQPFVPTNSREESGCIYPLVSTCGRDVTQMTVPMVELVMLGPMGPFLCQLALDSVTTAAQLPAFVQALLAVRPLQSITLAACAASARPKGFNILSSLFARSLGRAVPDADRVHGLQLVWPVAKPCEDARVCVRGGAALLGQHASASQAAHGVRRAASTQRTQPPQ